jgi:phospholipase C
LGDLARVRPRANDAYTCRPGNASNPTAGGFADRIGVAPASSMGLDTAIYVSPHHSFSHVRFQMGGGDEASAGSGAMDGFTRDIMDRTDAPQIVMSYYTEGDLPTYYRLADEFMVCDHWFCAHPGATFPNRWATLNGTIPEIDNLKIDDPRLGFLEDRTIFGLLDQRNIDWRYFESDVSIIRMFDLYRLDDNKVLPIADPADGLAALLSNPRPLPKVIFVEPDFVDVPPISQASDDHAPADLARGQAFVARICNLLFTSPHWEDLTLLITYDEHGGFFDHMAPPGTAAGDPAWIGRVQKIHPDGADFMGPRVPTMLVSPYVAAGSISHQVFDHTTIIKSILVRNRDKLRPDDFTSFGPRVNAAAHLGVALDLDTPRPRPIPFGAAAGPRASVSPRSLETAFVGAANAFATAATNAARPRPGRPTAPDPGAFAPTNDDVDEVATPMPTAPPTVSIEIEGWDEIPIEADNFHESLRRAMMPRRS